MGITSDKVSETVQMEAKSSLAYAAVYRVLLGGMALSTGLFVVGILLALMHPQFVPLTADPTRALYSAAAVAAGLRRADPMTIMLVATVLLILTPVARVVVSICAFARERDGRFTAITATVLGIIAATTALGLLGLK